MMNDDDDDDEEEQEENGEIFVVDVVALGSRERGGGVGVQ